MRILIDTNIIISREDPKVLPENLQFLMKVLNDLSTDILIHPLSVGEIKKDKNLDRREINLSKVSTYSILSNPPSFKNDAKFNSLITSKSPNDDIDNAILYSLYKNAVSFLITEDKGIHKKAYKIGIFDKVLSIEEALNVFKTEPLPITPPAIYKDKVYNLDIEDKIFDTLKDDYVEFTDWFKKIQKQGRDCLVYRNKDDSLGALLIYKDENESIELLKGSLPKKKRMKIATLIVSSSGNKIGEFFIQWAANYAIKKRFDEIYLTHFTKQEDYLVYLIETYGFMYAGKKNYQNKHGAYEDVFVKYLNPTTELIKKIKDDTPINLSKIFYPNFYDGEAVRKFIVPIHPEFHEKLFLDPGRQTTLYEHGRGFIIEGNTIKKAYLSQARLSKIKPGDLLLFYRTSDLKAITCIGVVEEVHHSINNKDEVTEIVGKRTVYSPKDITNLVEKSPVLILLFIFSAWLPNKVKLNKLKNTGVSSSALQRIHEISHETYLKIKKEGGINGSFTFN